MIKKNSKKFFLVILAATVFYLGEAAASAGPVHASSDNSHRNSRKGLPEEMVISADELRQKQLKKNNLVLLDARGEISYRDSHIQGALLPLTPEYYRQENLFKKGMFRHLPDPDAALKESMQKYTRDTLIVTYCTSGGCQASSVLALQIKRLGFRDVKAMEDGIQTWEKKGYPVESGNGGH